MSVLQPEISPVLGHGSTRQLPPQAALLAGALITAAAAGYVKWTAPATGAGFVVLPGLAFTAMLLLASTGIAERVRLWLQGHPLRIACFSAALFLLYFLHATGNDIATVRGSAVIAAYLFVPFLIPSRLWLEPLLILWIWLPLEFGVIRSIVMTNRGMDLHYAFVQMLGLNAGIALFVLRKRYDPLRYRLEWSREIAVTGVRAFLFFAAIAIPLGFAIGFIHFVPSLLKAASSPALFAGIFLFTAWPEEFLFRGLIQNWLERVLPRPAASLLLAAVIFGASHLNNGPPLPNYRYFLMATIAGLFYGYAWRRTRSLMAAALTHALVDTTWSVFFR